MTDNNIKEEKMQKPNRFGLPTKLLAVFLLLLSTALFCFSGFVALIAAKMDFYNGVSPSILIRRELTEHLHALSGKDLLDLGYYKMLLRDDKNVHKNSDYQYMIDILEERYDPSNSNILYKISDQDGNVLASNFKDAPTDYLAVYKTDSAGYYIESDINAGTENETGEKTGSESEGESTKVAETVEPVETEGARDTIFEARYIIEAYVISDLTVSDTPYYIVKFAEGIYETRYGTLILAMLTFFFSVADFGFLCYITGKRKGKIGAQVNFFDKIPFAVLGILYLCAYSAIFILLSDTSYYVMQHFEVPLIVILFGAIYVALFTLTLSLLLTVINRIKTKTFWRSFLIFRFCIMIGRGIQWAWTAIKEAMGDKVGFLVGGGLLFASAITDLLMMAAFGSNGANGGGFLLWMIKNAIIAILLLKSIVHRNRVLAGSRHVAEGDLSYKIETNTLDGTHKQIAENINHIGDGLQAALAEQVKAERMKTELITNVSHDIKTPLTCIINYVDLLKTEALDSEKADEYLEILDKQSAKLKKLIEDLIETSKTSSGNMQVSIEEVDIAILLSQAVGEYKDRFEEKRLSPVVQIPEGALLAHCDGRLCWRIFDNLLSNIAKYSLPGSRVYITAAETDTAVKITLKNISQNQLNISPDELTERFVRGDSSRNTDGSGLGLSIAQGLAKLQSGSLSLHIDGDLFTAVVALAK